MTTKIKFNHKAETVSGSMLIDDERAEFIMDQTKDAFFKCLSADKIINGAKAIDAAIEAIKPKTISEAIFIGYCAGNLRAKL